MAKKMAVGEPAAKKTAETAPTDVLKILEQGAYLEILQVEELGADLVFVSELTIFKGDTNITKYMRCSVCGGYFAVNGRNSFKQHVDKICGGDCRGSIQTHQPLILRRDVYENGRNTPNFLDALQTKQNRLRKDLNKSRPAGAAAERTRTRKASTKEARGESKLDCIVYAALTVGGASAEEVRRVAEEFITWVLETWKSSAEKRARACAAGAAAGSSANDGGVTDAGENNEMVLTGNLGDEAPTGFFAIGSAFVEDDGDGLDLARSSANDDGHTDADENNEMHLRHFRDRAPRDLLASNGDFERHFVEEDGDQLEPVEGPSASSGVEDDDNVVVGSPASECGFGYEDISKSMSESQGGNQFASTFFDGSAAGHNVSNFGQTPLGSVASAPQQQNPSERELLFAEIKSSYRQRWQSLKECSEQKVSSAAAARQDATLMRSSKRPRTAALFSPFPDQPPFQGVEASVFQAFEASMNDLEARFGNDFASFLLQWQMNKRATVPPFAQKSMIACKL